MRVLLEDCLSLAKDILQKEEEIAEWKLAAMSAKNQIITDMPKGGAQQNVMENYMLRLEKLEKEKGLLVRKQQGKWQSVIHLLQRAGIQEDSPCVEMLRIRFMQGYSWNKCVKKMCKKYPDGKWNANKCFRTYSSILHKISGENL